MKNHCFVFFKKGHCRFYFLTETTCRLLNILLDTQSKKRKRQLEKLDESQLEESHIDEPANVKFPK